MRIIHELQPSAKFAMLEFSRKQKISHVKMLSNYGPKNESCGTFFASVTFSFHLRGYKALVSTNF